MDWTGWNWDWKSLGGAMLGAPSVLKTVSCTKYSLFFLRNHTIVRITLQQLVKLTISITTIKFPRLVRSSLILAFAALKSSVVRKTHTMFGQLSFCVRK